ncbi:MAG TPA: cereblon family protein [Sandaracinaceae bacterium]
MLWLLDDPRRPVRAPAPRDEHERDVTARRALLCRMCRSAITTRAARIEVHGAHEHRRVNPSGVDFHLGCFARAPGCIVEGEPTTFWTWFPGYAWQIASCRTCGEHLGWAFSGETSFFGLILPRMVEA